MKTLSTDVLIIGSGFGGAVPALRLASLGFSTTLLEKGTQIDPYQTFRQTQDPKYMLKYFRNLSGAQLSLQYIEALGGGSGFYEAMSFRAPGIVFQAKDKKGERLWPESISREGIDTYYKQVEEVLNVHQIPENEVPKNGQVFSMLMKKCNYSVERARFAARNCQNSGYCVTGCIYGAKQSLLLNYLPEAKNHGANIVTEMEAFAIKPILNSKEDSNTLPYSYWVLCRDKTKAGEVVYYKTKILIVSAGTIGTAKLLLSSKVNLPELSREVGKNISFNGSIKAIAELPSWCPDGDMYEGRSQGGVVSYQFLETDKVMIMAGKVTPMQLVAAARFNTKDMGFPHWGEGYNSLLKKFRRRLFILAALGIEPSTASMTLDTADRPMLYLNMNKDLQDHYNRYHAILDSIFRKTGCKQIPYEYIDRKGNEQATPYFASSHHLGSCRMSDSIQRGVVDPNGEVFNYPRMYVCDGSAIPASTIVNPSLTILANSERITRQIINTYGKFAKA